MSGYGKLTVDATSKIDVSGKGCVGALAPGLICQPFVSPPLTDGCSGRTLGNLPGSSANGSYGGLGTGPSNPVYGDFRQSVDLGSGGGAFGCGFGCQRGAPGGGVVKITSGQIVLDGSILANGGQAPPFGRFPGSGGSIWLTTRTLSGSGILESSGLRGGDLESSSGGGRIAIYYADAGGCDLSRIQALGGPALSSNPARPPVSGGGAGTIFLKSDVNPFGQLIIDNGDRSPSPRSTPLRAVGSATSGALTSNSLTDNSASYPVPNPVTGAIGLKGLELNPNTAQRKTFTIIDNTATTLFTDPADGDMTAVAGAGDQYGGVEQLDEIVIRAKASFALGNPFLSSTAVSVDDAQVFGVSLEGGPIQFS